MQEEKIDRRLHWAQIIISGIVVAVGWCVKLEMTTAQLKLDMANHMAARDATIATLWGKIGEDHDRLNRVEKDVEWLRREHP